MPFRAFPPNSAKAYRAQSRQVRELEYIVSATCVGSGTARRSRFSVQARRIDLQILEPGLHRSPVFRYQHLVEKMSITAENHHAIQNTIASYCFALDNKDWPLLSSVFTPDADAFYPFPGGHLKGVDVIANRIKERYRFLALYLPGV